MVVLAPGQDRGCPRHECERRGRQVLAPATSSDDPPGALQKFATFRYYHLSVAGKTSLTGAAITVFHKKTRSTMSVIVSLVWEGASGRPLGCLARACAGEVCQPRAICQASCLLSLWPRLVRPEQTRLSRKGAEVTLRALRGCCLCQPGRHVYGAAVELQLCPPRSCWLRTRAQEGQVLAVEHVLNELA